MSEERTEQVIHELPLLPGQRVIINPELSGAKQLYKEAEGQVGIVVDPLGEDYLRSWIARERKRSNVTVKVLFEGKRVYEVQSNVLLEMDMPYEDVTICDLDFKTAYQINDKMYMNANVIQEDDYIIKNRCQFLVIKRYDSAWREKIMKNL